MEFFDKLGKKASEAYKVTADKTGKIAKVLHNLGKTYHPFQFLYSIFDIAFCLLMLNILLINYQFHHLIHQF